MKSDKNLRSLGLIKNKTYIIKDVKNAKEQKKNRLFL